MNGHWMIQIIAVKSNMRQKDMPSMHGVGLNMQHKLNQETMK